MSSISLQQTFTAFKYYNYRLWFVGQLVSTIGSWMQGTAQGYLVYQITQSPAYLGYVSFAAGIPTWLFTLYGGVIADRLPRRTLMLITQTVMLLLAFILALLVFLNTVQPWHIILLSFMLGIANAFDAPARQAFVVELVDRQDMTNAIALNASMFNLATVLGPAIGGLTYALVGPAWCFTLNGISFVAILIALLMMRLSPFQPPTNKSSTMSQLAEGLRYTASHKTIRIIVLNMGMVSLFGMGMMSLMPAWATVVLKGDVTINGLLLSARGAGALIGALGLASLSTLKIRGKLWMYGSFIMAVLTFIFALTNWLPASLLTMVLIGLGFVMVANVSNALVQSLVANELRGRVMAIYTMTFMGLGPIGSLLIGLMATYLSEPVTVIISAVVLLVSTTVVRLMNPEIQRLE